MGLSVQRLGFGVLFLCLGVQASGLRKHLVGRNSNLDYPKQTSFKPQQFTAVVKSDSIKTSGPDQRSSHHQYHRHHPCLRSIILIILRIIFVILSYIIMIITIIIIPIIIASHRLRSRKGETWPCHQASSPAAWPLVFTAWSFLLGKLGLFCFG